MMNKDRLAEIERLLKAYKERLAIVDALLRRATERSLDDLSNEELEQLDNDIRAYHKLEAIHDAD